MSLLTQVGRYLKTAPSAIRPLRLAWEDDVGEQSPVKRAESRVVEGTALAAVAVGRSEASGFTHFLDGIQRSQPVWEINGVCAVYGYVAAVVRHRPERRLETSWWECREALYGPAWLRELSGFDPAIWVEAGSLDEADWRAASKQALDEQRAHLERQAAEWWCQNARGWLMVDGNMEVALSQQTVGVIKSHQTQYFSTDDQGVIWGLRPGERSSVFEPLGKRRMPVFSWYLRLRDPGVNEVTFGLVRVEMASSLTTLAMADEVSRWLMAETAPLSLPDPRWDRMLYPIRDCEQYLKSKAPSRILLESLS